LGDQPEFFPRNYGFDYYYGIPFSNDMGGEPDRPRKNLPPLPLMRNEEIIEAPVDQRTVTKKYTAEAVRFIEDNKDKPFLLYLPHMHVHLPYRPGADFAGTSDNEAYGDMVAELDWSTGQVLKAIQRLGLDENTLVIFTSDNGAMRHGSNAPLSGGKASTMEGGMRVPCVMRWPGKVPAGKTCDEVCSTLDVLPTLAKLAGTKPPADRVIDGKDIADLMFCKPGAASPHTEGFFYYFMSQLQAVRLGKWKLRLPLTPEIGKWMGVPQGDTEARLYDLEADIGEKNNVAAKHPDVVAKLAALAEKARADIGDYQRQGTGAREPGHVEKPVFLRKDKP
jgi:arylsulfatase A-like enzyme